MDSRVVERLFETVEARNAVVVGCIFVGPIPGYPALRVRHEVAIGQLPHCGPTYCVKEDLGIAWEIDEVMLGPLMHTTESSGTILGVRGDAVVFGRMRPDEVERQLQARLDALPPAARAELLHVLMLPDFDRADRIGEFWGKPKRRAFAELLIDCEEDRTLRAVLVGMLREADRKGR